MNAPYNKILAAAEPENFIGRSREIELLRRHAAGEMKSPALLVSSAPAAGASELLKQFYDRLFAEPNAPIPVYFPIKDSDRTAKNCAARFLQNLITQTIAFRQQNARIIDVAPDVGELAELAAPEDRHWIERLAAACSVENQLHDDRVFVRQCLSAPLRAAASGARLFLMIDHLDETEFFSGEIDFIEEVKEIFSRASQPFVLAGRRRFLSKAALAGNAKLIGAKVLPVEPLVFADAGDLIENAAARYAVEINDAARDLVAVKCQGNPTFIEFILQAAGERQINLDSFRRVEQIYTDEIFGGRTKRFLDALLHKIAPNIENQKEAVKFFHDALTNGNEKTPVEELLKNCELDSSDARRLISLLDVHEIVRLESGQIEPMTENEVLSDYAAARFRLETTTGETRAAIVGETLSALIKRAPQTMAKFYRRRAAINLRETLALFNLQETPLALLDYSIYKERLKDSETIENVGDDAEKIILPQTIFAAHTAAFYPPFEQIAERARSATAIGFANKTYADADETVWLAAEIDSKLEASAEAAEFWCDRLEMVALRCDFPNYVVWLVAPEGFAPEAVEILKQRNAFGSSRRQVELLKNFLENGVVADAPKPAAEYEIIVPMQDDSELIAAGTVEEIARRANFAPKAINQIKTAVVEACINAAEHSLSPERKIYQKIRVEANKIIVTISNRGLRLADKKAEAITPAENRRGWGLKLIETLMDEVRFEQVDDGTRISMTKYRPEQTDDLPAEARA